MPYGHAESNDLLRNRERSIRYAKSYATEFGKNAVGVNNKISIPAFSKFSLFSVFGFVELR